MKAAFVAVYLVICVFPLSAQFTVFVSSVPPNTPPSSDIFIAGNFNNWNPGDPAFQLTDHQDGTFSITFSPSPGQLQFKFTRGSWATVEGNANGGFIPNRTYTYPGGIDTASVSIGGWEDISGGGTTEEHVQILDADFYMPQLDRTRRIWIYLPPDYASTAKRYPVIYMQDGQNLFDPAYSFAGEWMVDESMTNFFDEGDYSAIVVGIDNGGSERIDEYSPWINSGYGGGDGEAYASFIVETLKPFIDAEFRTRPEREYTGIAGSSLGANISMYAAVEYQDVFSKVGIFSPAFWFSDSSYLHIAEEGIDQDLRVYFVAGENESPTMVSNMMKMYDALVLAGQDENERYFISHADGAHSEWYWAREYPAAYAWLFEELVLSLQPTSEIEINVYPNPVGDQLKLDIPGDALQYSIYTMTGEIWTQQVLTSTSIDTSMLVPGIYFVSIEDKVSKVKRVSRFVKQ